MPKKTSRVVQCHRDLTQLACVHLHGKRVRENPNVATARNFLEILYFEVLLKIEINFGLQNKFEVLADLNTFPGVRE